jgi:type VI secretion system protein ImpG
MDPRLLRHYNQELQHLREMGAEFALQFPKIAARLGMDGIEVADPYVERLMEGFAFLAARVQLKIAAEFPHFSERLLEIVYPNYLAPTPAMLIAQFSPDLSEGNLARGFSIPRGCRLRSQFGRSDTSGARSSEFDQGDALECQFRTAHDVTLWPIEIVAAEYFSYAPDLPLNTLRVGHKVKGGVRLRLRATAGLNFSQIELDELSVHLSGSAEVAFKLYENILGACIGVMLVPPNRPIRSFEFLPDSCVRRVGFDDEEALLPITLRGFQGSRLLQEYFAFPQRFLFFQVVGLAKALREQVGNELELVLLFDKGDSALERVVGAANFALNCTPAINLFERRCDRIHLSDSSHSYHVVPDRTRPMDFEVFEIRQLVGFGPGSDGERTFLPLYAAYHGEDLEHGAYYTIQREPRLLSPSQKRSGPRSSYVGSEIFVSLVDPGEAPFSTTLRQLGVTALCTNRDLPLHMPVRLKKTDFTLDVAAPVDSIRIVSGPSKPSPAAREGNVAWKMINQLSLNYLSLIDTDAGEGVAVLRDMLRLYLGSGDSATHKQLDGLRSIKVQASVRRLPVPGLITFGRGLRINLDVDELAFEGASAFLFGSVMEQFFSRYVSINSFTETVLSSRSRGEIMRWVPRCGERQIV